MCTLIAGVDVLGPRTLVLGANRDESPRRESRGPGVLRERPRVVGGQDALAGGTWLAVREARFVTALMNRRPNPAIARPEGMPPPRSRGLLCLDAAAGGPADGAPVQIDPGTADRHPSRLVTALGLIEREAYAACTLVGLDLDEPSWAVLAEAGAEIGVRMLDRGWNVVTHADVNDASEPRTAWLMDRLKGFRPGDVDAAFECLRGLLAAHEDAEAGVPGVCLHRERFPTVSSTLLALGDLGDRGRPRYLHAPGAPCVTPYEDVSPLLA